MCLRPCLAASFLAAFLLLPRPVPQHSPSTIALATQQGVALVLSVMVPSKTHSIGLLSCCRRWLKRPRWPWVAELGDALRHSSGGVGGAWFAPAMAASSSLFEPTGERPCCSRTMRYASR